MGGALLIRNHSHSSSMLPGPGQMAQLLHPQDSGFYGRKEMGGRWSFLELFGLRRRLRSTKKMLSDKKHGSRLQGCYVPFKDEDGVTDEQRVIIDEHINTKVTNKQKSSKKSSGKSGLKSLFSRKLHGKEDQKEKMLPVGPKLLRTLSIHYLENNDYVLDGQSAANGDGSSHGAKLSLQNGTSTNLQQDAFSNLDGTGTDMGLPLLSANGDDNVKRKSHRSISMDGILHKVPYGQRVSGDNIRLELPRSASSTYDRDGLKPSYIGTAAKRQGSRGFRRSRSLSESLESYSHLLDSISSSESKRVLTSSKSTRDHSLDGPGAATSLQRTSNSQLRSKSVVRLAEFLVIPEDTLAAEVPEAIVGGVKLAVEEGSCSEVASGSENPVSLEELLSDKKCEVVESSTEAGLCIAPLASSEMVDVSEGEAATSDDDLEVLSSTQAKMCSDPSASEVDIPEEHAASGDNDLIHSSTEADPCTLLTLLQSEDISIAEQQVTPNSDDQIQSGTTAHPSEDINIAEEHAMVSEDNQIQSFDALKSVKGTCCVPDPNRDTEDELNLCCEQETESPTSVLDVAFSDHPAASSEKNHTLLDDSSPVGKTVHSNESPDHSVDNDDDLESSTSVKPPTSSSSTQENILQENNLSDLNALQEEAAADPKNEAELAYVRDIFSKSSFREEALFDGWCSQNRAALQEDDCQHYDAAAAAIDFTDMSADELLLFDLTNEALLDVYKDYAAGVSRQPRFSSFQRPKPVGERALRELRRRVGRRLDERPRASVEVDAVLSSDLAEAERWSNFRREADQVAGLVADSVLDRLVAELALQLVKF